MTIRMTILLSVLTVGLFLAAGPASAQPPKPGAATQPASAAPASAPSLKALQPLPGEKSKPFAIVRRTAKAPAIDGQIEPDIWGDKPTLTNFSDDETAKPVAKNVQTLVWLLYDNEKLYIAAKMLEPQMNELSATITERDGTVWLDDDIELFIDPANKKDPAEYLHIAINPLGTVSDERGAPDVSGDTAWDCKNCTVKAAKGKDFWVVEMAIPFKSLGVTKPVAGTHWGINFARDRKAGNAEKGSWANIGPQWHQPDQFGHIAFEP